MLFSCFCIALVTLISTSILMWYKRKQFNYSVRIMLIGVIGVITILIYPMYKSMYDPGTSLLFSLLYALRALTGCQSVDVSHKVLVEGWLYYGYYALLYIAFIIAPIFTTGFLVSIFGNLSDKVRYLVLPGKMVHVFSELNESAVLLGESMDSRSASFVFCNTDLTAKDKDTDIVKRARKIGAVILDKSELDIKIKKKHICFYQVSKSKDYNANSTIALVEKYRRTTDKDIKIATFSTGVTTELLLDSIDKGHIRIKLIDEVKYSCYTLLDQAPLFEGIVNGKLSALIVGCDYTGMEMLKAIYWCGQMENVELEINVVDKCANEKEKKFRIDCPDINPEECGIHFIQADVKSIDFETALDNYCKDTNYVVVVTGDDKLNIDTAVYLRKYFLRRDRNHFHNKPKINLRVRDALKNKQMDALSDANIKAYELYAFGSVEKTFSIHNLLGTDLEKMAVGVHLAYSDVLNGTVEQRDAAMESYYCKEYNQRSSFATALHIKYKLFSCGVRDLSGDSINAEQISAFEELLRDPDVLERMSILEHQRWNAFMKTEGYSLANIQDVKTYYSLSDPHTHIHYLAKLHPTILEWDELDELSKQISDIMDKDFNFKQNDYDIVRRLPDIVRASIID